MADVTCKLVLGIVPDGSAPFDWDITDAGITAAPKGLLTVGGNVGSADGLGEARNSVGFADEDGNEGAMSFTWKDGATTTDEAAKLWDSRMVVSMNNFSSGSDNGVAEWKSWLSNGVRLNVTDDWFGDYSQWAPTMFFGGTDVQTAVGSLTIATAADGTATVSGLAFEPDFVIVLYGNTTVTGWPMAAGAGYGIAANKAGLPQLCATGGSRDNRTTSTVQSGMFNNRVGAAGKSDYSALDHTLEITSFTSDGFVVTTRDGTADSGDALLYMAVSLGGADFWLGEVDLPTSAASDWEVTDPGFEPQCGILYSTLFETADLNTVSNAVDTVQGMSMWDDSSEYNFSWVNEDGVTTTNTAIRSNAKLLKMRDAADTVMFDIENVQNISTGFKVAAADIATANATQRKGFALVIGQGAGPSAAVLAPAIIAGL